MSYDEVVEDAYAFVRGHTVGDLRFDEHVRSIKYVIEPEGRLVAPVMVAMLTALDTVLFIPGMIDGASEFQVTLEAFEEHGPAGALADRWRIFHGDPPDVRWAYLRIDAARHRGMVIDGDVLERPNPLAADEPALCRLMNEARTDDLRAMCVRWAAIRIEHPVMVGIDPLGLSVRGAFDVARLTAPEPMVTADDARRVLEMMSLSARTSTADETGDG